MKATRLPEWSKPAASVILSAAVYGIFLNHGFAPMVIGYNLVPSERVLAGEMPFRDFLFNYTPGLLWLNALLFKLAGTSLMTARAGVFAAKVLTGLLLFLIARRMISGWMAIVPVLMMFAWIGYGDVLKVFPTQYGMALLLGACLAIMRAQQSVGQKSERPWLFLAGSLVAAVFVFKHNVGVFALLAAMAGAAVPAALPHGDRSVTDALKAAFAAVLPIAAGFVLIAGAMAIYLAANSALWPMLGHFARHAAEYGDEKGEPLPSVLLLLPFGLAALAVFAIRAITRKALNLYFVVLIAGLLFILVAGERGPTAVLYRSLVASVYYLPLIAAIPLLLRFQISNFKSEITLALFALAAYLEIFPRSDVDHLVRVLPPSLLLIFALLVGAGKRRLAIALSVLVIALGVRVTWASQFGPDLRLVESASLTFERGRGVSAEAREAERFNNLVAYVEERSEPGDPIFCLSRKLTSLYFLAARPNITRLLWYDSAGITDAEREPIYRALTERRFKLVVIGSDLDRADPRTMSVIAENYHLEKVINDVSLFAPNP